jgi:hypothetical protein
VADEGWRCYQLWGLDRSPVLSIVAQVLNTSDAFPCACAPVTGYIVPDIILYIIYPFTGCVRPCKIRCVPLGCHCNSGVNGQYRRDIHGKHSLTPSILAVYPWVATVTQGSSAGIEGE